MAPDQTTQNNAVQREDGRAGYTQLQAFLAQQGSFPNDRLPPERELCSILGVSRGELRKALSIAEAEGQVWRHVGKGTFIGPKPADTMAGVASVAQLTNPTEVMRARLILEPQLAREAALHATVADVAELKLYASKGRHAKTWRQYESWDNRFHRAIAEATQNKLLVVMFDTLNTVRRAVVWGRLRADPDGPPPSHHSFDEHDAIVRAIEERELDQAADLMRAHLDHVGQYMHKPS